MPSAVRILAALGAAATVTVGAEEVYQGFNYGATFNDGSVKVESDFEAEFQAAAKLAGTDGAFTSARFYTMIQAGTENEPTSAIQAAINTNTSVLLGLWASSGDGVFANELTALRNAIAQFAGKGLNVAGISVGSEDLYRISPVGIANNEFAGAGPDTLVSYISQVRDMVRGTEFNVPIGHVDTWTAWVNGSNDGVIEAVDWIGVDAYAYFEDTRDNDIANGAALFDEAVDATRAAVEGKPIWVTETGWPVSGRDFGSAQAGVDNAKRFWDEVGCGKLFGSVNTWWFTFQDARPTTPNPSFGVVGSDVNGAPVFDLSCSSGGDGGGGNSSSSTDSGGDGASSSSTGSEESTSSQRSSSTGSPTPNSGGGGGSNQTYTKVTPTPGGEPTASPTYFPAAAAPIATMSSITALLGVVALAVVFAAGLA